MATTVFSSAPANGVILAEWSSLANLEAGDRITVPQHSDKSVSITGTFGTGGSVTIQGSNDGTTWVTLHDPQGNDLTFTAANAAVIAENMMHTRPNVTAGDGTTALKVMVVGVQS